MMDTWIFHIFNAFNYTHTHTQNKLFQRNNLQHFQSCLMKPQSLNIKTLTTYYKEENLETSVPYECRCKNLK